MSIDPIRAALDTIDATPRDGFLDELEERLLAEWNDDAELDPTDVPVWAVEIAPHPQRRRRRWMLTAAAALVVLAVGLMAFVADRDPDRDPTDPVSPAPTTVADEPLGAFSGSWESTDTDGSAQTMTIEPTGADSARMLLGDDVASVACSGAAATIAGNGELASGGDVLVLTIAELTCADGSEPAVSGEGLGAYTLTHDSESDTLTDNSGVIWRREGAEGPVPAPLASGGMWPQTSLDEVRHAQELADAGDPDHTWQVDSALVSLEWWEHLSDSGSEIVTRFLREELGWEGFLFNPYAADLDNIDGDNGGSIGHVVYLRCAPGEVNPLYPNPEDGDTGGAHQCAPTIDDFRYEAVSLDLNQPLRLGSEGIWVVSGWRTIAPFSQIDPRVVEDEATARLEDFLQARIDGESAEGRVEVNGLSDLVEVPLLYTTSTGSSYERYEIERVSPPQWPDGHDLSFTVRLFADGGRTVVEQQISAFGAELTLAELETTENGQPLAAPYSLFDGEVTLVAPAPWKYAFEQNAALVLGQDDYLGRNIELVADPFPVAPDCGRGQAPADAEALAASIQANPDLVTTASLPTTIAGAEGLVLDVTVAADANICGVLTPGPDAGYEQRRGEGTLAPGSRMRLYLLDHPEGSPATRILAIAVVAPEAQFDAVFEAAAPIIESIEFHTD